METNGKRCTIGGRIALVIVLAAALSSGSSCRVAEARGAFAFHYEQPLTEAQLEWYARFDLLVTHDPLPREQVEFLRKRGTRLVLYEWAVAFYASRASAWQRTLLTRPGALLHEQPLRGGAGSDDADAWYYDPAHDAHQRERARSIARHLEEIGYDGVFLDTTSEESVHPAARANFAQRHPGSSYDEAYARFLAELRTELRGKVIFTNQGFRAADHILPYADWDLTESLVTYPRDGQFVRRPWNDPADPWNSIHFLMLNMLGPARERHPRVRFGHLNYSRAGDTALAQDTWVIARLFDSEGFVSAPGLSDEIHGAYFSRLGDPRTERVDAAGARGSYRSYERGILAVAERGFDLDVPNRHGRTFVDQDGTRHDERVIRLRARDDAPFNTWILLEQ